MARVMNGEVQILLGTQSIFSEGISVNRLSCLILATPVSNTPLLTQLIGRVIRNFEGKKDPVIVDINLKGKTAERQAQVRLGHYMKEGYRINQIEM
jgi:superfamily II DNA or RNA helicase